MHVDNIDYSGLANGPAELAGFTALDSPFGGTVIITGHITDPPNIAFNSTKLKYRITYSNDGSTWRLVDNKFDLRVDQNLNGNWTSLPIIEQKVDANGWYEYQEDLQGGSGNPQYFPAGNVLGRWMTHGLNGLYILRIEVYDPTDATPNIWSDMVLVKLDNERPEAEITITSGGGPCSDFVIGDVIDGTYSATDIHFGSLQLTIVPGLGGSFTTPAPLPAGPTMPLKRSYSGVSTNGESGNWSLDTTGMPRCGYVVYLHVVDRTIVNSGPSGFHQSANVGLCLREPDE
jgi:hypothetical protein